jgi:hypothetical protein
MYFQNFPSILYPFAINGEKRLIATKDITLNVRAIKSVQENVLVYDEYLMKTGDTPEIVAELLYGDPYLHWTIMLVNQKYDYINDFPIDEVMLEQVVEEKYGVGQRDAQHVIFGRPHWEDPNGNIVDADSPGATIVTNFDYEVKVNESKRSIKVVSPNLINVFIKDVREAFNSNV